MSYPYIPSPPPFATSLVAGLVSTVSQSFAGNKTFTGIVRLNNALSLNGSSGSVGQTLVSAGSGLPPVWKDGEMGFDVKDYGAVGDGVTNDRDAIQAAINAAVAVGGVVWFPNGSYLCNTSLTLPTAKTIQLLGSLQYPFGDITTVRTGAHIWCKNITGGTFDVSAGVGTISIRGLAFDGANGSHPAGIPSVAYANFSTTWTGLFSGVGANSYAGVDLEDICVMASKTTNAIGVDVRNADQWVNLSKVNIVSFVNGYGLKIGPGSVGHTCTTVSVDKSYIHYCHVGVNSNNIQNATFSDTVIESSIVAVENCLGQIHFKGCYLENIGYDPMSLGRIVGLTQKSFSISWGGALGTAMSAYTDTAIYSLYGGLTFDSCTFAYLASSSVVAWFEGIGLGSGISACGSAIFNSCRSQSYTNQFLRGETYPGTKSDFMVTVHDTSESAKSNKNINNMTDIRRVDFGETLLWAGNGIAKIQNGKLLLGFSSTFPLSTPPATNPDGGAWASGDRCQLGSDVAGKKQYTHNGSAWVMTGQSWFNVADYGAVGDSVTDDTAAIQAAITAAAAAVGGTVFIPAGNYLCAHGLSVPSGVSVVGSGASSCLVFNTTSEAGLTLGTLGAPGVMATRVTLRDFSILGTATPGTHAITAWLLNLCDINVYINGPWQHMLYVWRTPGGVDAVYGGGVEGSKINIRHLNGTDIAHPAPIVSTAPIAGIYVRGWVNASSIDAVIGALTGGDGIHLEGTYSAANNCSLVGSFQGITGAAIAISGTGQGVNIHDVHCEGNVNTYDITVDGHSGVNIGASVTGDVAITGCANFTDAGHNGQLAIDSTSVSPRVTQGCISDAIPLVNASPTLTSDGYFNYTTPGGIWGPTGATPGDAENLCINGDMVRMVGAAGAAVNAYGVFGQYLGTQCGVGLADTTRTLGSHRCLKVETQPVVGNYIGWNIPSALLTGMEGHLVTFQFKWKLVSGTQLSIFAIRTDQAGTSYGPLCSSVSVGCELGFQLARITAKVTADMVTHGMTLQCAFPATVAYISEAQAQFGSAAPRNFSRREYTYNRDIELLGDGRVRALGTAAPTGSDPYFSAPWRVGDMATNSVPAVGQPAGWVCTVAGTPGTWTTLDTVGTAGDVTLAAVGSTPNANGASLSGQVLNLQPADVEFPGVVTTGTQSFAGTKYFGEFQPDATWATLTVDAANHKVGIFCNESVPLEKTFEVGGTVHTTGILDTPAIRTSYRSTATSIAITTSNHKVSVKGNSAPVTLTLPSAASSYDSTWNRANEFVIKDASGLANTYNITITPAGADTIDGAASLVLNSNYASVTLTSDGVSNWEIS
jgi:hypothetical protein